MFHIKIIANFLLAYKLCNKIKQNYFNFNHEKTQNFVFFSEKFLNFKLPQFRTVARFYSFSHFILKIFIGTTKEKVNKYISILPL